jgi:ribonuclease HII
MPDLSREQERWEQGEIFVVGVDEAGRGPLAGPVSAGAVILPEDFTHELLNDSKKLSEKKRDLLFEELIQREDVQCSHAYAEVEEIDEKNILRATHAAMARAVDALKVAVDYVLIDGLPVANFPYPSEGIVKGDGKSLSIAAASIIAKVSRDRKMLELAQLYPEYGFEKHKGYGTKQHLAALEKHGPCSIHRRSFAPVSRLL